MQAYFSNVKDVESRVNEFHFLKEYKQGYLWVFPIEDNVVNVGLGILNNSRNKVDAKNSFKSILENNPTEVGI